MKNTSILASMPIGRCPACQSQLILENATGAEWARCIQCQARFPLVSGYKEESNYEIKQVP